MLLVTFCNSRILAIFLFYIRNSIKKLKVCWLKINREFTNKFQLIRKQTSYLWTISSIFPRRSGRPLFSWDSTFSWLPTRRRRLCFASSFSYFSFNPLTVLSLIFGNWGWNFLTHAAEPFSLAYLPISNLSFSLYFLYLPRREDFSLEFSMAITSTMPNDAPLVAGLVPEKCQLCMPLCIHFSNSHFKDSFTKYFILSFYFLSARSRQKHRLPFKKVSHLKATSYVLSEKIIFRGIMFCFLKKILKKWMLTMLKHTSVSVHVSSCSLSGKERKFFFSKTELKFDLHCLHSKTLLLFLIFIVEIRIFFYNLKTR